MEITPSVVIYVHERINIIVDADATMKLAFEM
jgi:hypothetical protein